MSRSDRVKRLEHQLAQVDAAEVSACLEELNAQLVDAADDPVRASRLLMLMEDVRTAPRHLQDGAVHIAQSLARLSEADWNL